MFHAANVIGEIKIILHCMSEQEGCSTNGAVALTVGSVLRGSIIFIGGRIG